MKRGRNQRRRQGVNPNRALDSNGPDVRIRGTANQIYDKYQALARDASSAGDRIKAESYLQHAEHYFRLIRSMQAQQQPQVQNAAPGDEADAEQPVLDDEEEPRRPKRKRRAANGAAAGDGDVANGDPAEEGAENAAAVIEQPTVEAAPDPAPAVESAADKADAGEEKQPAAEKKPRRRRTTRRPTKRAEDTSGAGEAVDTAAAE